MSLVLQRSHGFPVDHFALAVPDTEAGVAHVEALTGAKVDLHDTEPGQWYWSGSLPLGPDCFLEVLGPNPDWRGFNPMRKHLAALKEPELMFWYVATDDFSGFCDAAKAAGAPVQRVEHINQEDDPDFSRYSRGILGPGFLTQRPCVIEWARRGDKHQGEAQCSLQDFSLQHPDAAKLNATFQALGIASVVKEGAPQISATLDTPNGSVTLSSAGIAFSGIGSLLKLYLRGRL